MTRARPTGHHHGNLRSALLRAALELVAERGAQGFTLAEASRRAGVSVAAPYKHFADREALLAELARTGYEQQYERFSAAMAAEEDPTEQLAAFAAAYVRFAANSKALFDITFAAGLNKQRHPDLGRAGDRVLHLLSQPAGRLVHDPDEALDLVHGVGATAHGFAALLAEGVFGDPDEALESTTRRARRTARKLVTGRADLPDTSTQTR
ncbi:TetR/AcrR family transcriptional regulator [Plantactinospora sp. CA-294935]|uniref:TetR/AcrR family transcriptional regulator n=1 Tax=Plantactinospora sp. CA-294935 TaxID=3240012 RepID=UPI003D8B4F56